MSVEAQEREKAKEAKKQQAKGGGRASLWK